MEKCSRVGEEIKGTRSMAQEHRLPVTRTPAADRWAPMCVGVLRPDIVPASSSPSPSSSCPSSSSSSRYSPFSEISCSAELLLSFGGFVSPSSIWKRSQLVESGTGGFGGAPRWNSRMYSCSAGVSRIVNCSMPGFWRLLFKKVGPVSPVGSRGSPFPCPHCAYFSWSSNLVLVIDLIFRNFFMH